MPKTPKEFQPRKKPSLVMELLAYVFIYGPIFTFFYVSVKGLNNLFGYEYGIRYVFISQTS